ncbi:hypothetical protein [Haloarchaeobius litoreus]|uniref:Ig-like domain-containing protein n=1 Tax=Haloarchaeobius litoreus TaxID=755306 RepID=A0ABD6DLZ5_9EURY|nr:hypothetical protein [Haloarchaeobius litoreus]
MQLPSRRALLSTVGGGLSGALAGCLDRDRTGTEAAETSTGTATARPTATEPLQTAITDGALDAHVSVHNDGDAPATVTAELRRDGTVVDERTRDVNDGVVALLFSVPEPGSYTVSASLDAGGSATHDWRVEAGYRGSLTVQVDGSGEPSFEETLVDRACATGEGTTTSLPYSIPDAPETHTRGRAELANESGDPVTVTLAVAHDSLTFFECTYELDADQTVAVEGLTATAGEYTVDVDVETGGRTVSRWRIPPDYAWPLLSITVPAEGNPLVGCGEGGDVQVAVDNATDSAVAATLALERDGQTVGEQSLDLPAGGSEDIALSTPVGDFYSLVVTADTGTASAAVVRCYCYRSVRTGVTLDAGRPRIDTGVRRCT